MSPSGVQEPAAPTQRACDRCLGRAWLLVRLAGHLEPVRGRISPLLELGDDDLIDAVGGERAAGLRQELKQFDADRARRQTRDAGLESICRCDPGYPARLAELPGQPAVLHVSGGLSRFLSLVGEQPVAIVGARRPSAYGLEMARSLGRGLAASGLTVVSGMALGVDTAAHTGALQGGTGTVAVLPGGAERAYPPTRRALHRQIQEAGATVSELPPGAGVWRWTFPARNRIIAALSAITVVVEAGERSGALLTAGYARSMGRLVAAVPGRVTTPQAAGPNGLLVTGAKVVRGPQDVLDLLFGKGTERAVTARREKPVGALAMLLSAIAEGQSVAGALAVAGLSTQQGLAALASLELTGHIRRGPGGSFSAVP